MVLRGSERHGRKRQMDEKWKIKLAPVCHGCPAYPSRLHSSFRQKKTMAGRRKPTSTTTTGRESTVKEQRMHPTT